MCRSDISILETKQGEVNFIPNHKHCGVCKINYEDMQVHVISNEHKQAIKIQNNLYSLIDKEMHDIKLIGFKKKWKTSPVRVKSPITSPCPKKLNSG